MKISLISLNTPTPENRGAASALPYHLAKYRGDEIDLTIYSFNLNAVSDAELRQIEGELNAEIRVMPVPYWFKLCSHSYMQWLRVLLRYPFQYYLRLSKGVVREINVDMPDAIWLYLEEFVGISRQLKKFKLVHSLPDCESLYYKRLLAQRRDGGMSLDRLRKIIMWRKYRRLERSIVRGIRCHVVGAEDAKELKSINNLIDVRFIRHPHYDTYMPTKDISFTGSKIKIVLAGQNNLYMTPTAKEWICSISREPELALNYEFTFLGKGWYDLATMLRNAGFSVNEINFAPNYAEELVRHDIQITPISIGTGTKGKVLDALANGLLVIGTPYAMENIAVETGKSCIVYENANDVVTVLKDIIRDREKYESMAEAGRQVVLREHSRAKVATEFFEIFMK